MTDNQKVYDSLVNGYVVETEQQPDGSHRQVVAVASGGSSPVQVTSATVTTDTAGSASSETLAANTARKSLSIYNSHATDTAYINIGSAATTSDIPIRAGEWWHMAEYGVVFTEAINCIRGGSNDITLVVVHG